MKAFFLRNRKLHIWLLADLGLLAAFWLCRSSRGVMTFLASGATSVRRFLGALCYQVPFSVAELLCVLLVMLAVGYLIWNGAAIARRGQKFRLSRFSLLSAGVTLTVISLICGSIVMLGSVDMPVSSRTRTEFLLALAWPWGLAALVWCLAAILLDRERRARAYSALLGALGIGLTIYVGFCYLWGVHYYTDSFQDRSGIYAQPVAQEDLVAVTQYFADRLTESADRVERDENGLFAVSREEILADSIHAYDALEQEFPFLAFEDLGVKPVHFSRIMSALDFTGSYCPYTGESNVNVDSPACLLPSTAAHELAHQRSIALEQECNFLAILACTTCGSDAYAYSGWLLGYIHLGNALYKVDPDTYQSIRDTLPATVRADLADNNAYWAQFEDSAAQKVSNQVYEGFLKSYGEEDGLQSYGMVVDLLVTYYHDAARAS